MQKSTEKAQANPANLQVRLSSFFILKLAVCSLQDIDGGLADMNSQSWKRHRKSIMRAQPSALYNSAGGLSSEAAPQVSVL